MNYLFETEDLVFDLRKVISIYRMTFGLPETRKYIEIIMDGKDRTTHWSIDLKYWDELKASWKKVVNEKL